MNLGLAGAHRRRDLETCVGHGQWVEQVLAHVGAQFLAAGDLDQAPGVVDVDAVVPARAGIEQEWRPESRVLAGEDSGRARDHLIAADLGVPDVVAEASGMCEQMAQCDRRFRRAQLGFAAGIEALQNLHLGKFRHPFAGGRFEIELALLDQLHGGGARDGLGHRGDPDDGIERHGLRLAERAHAMGTLVEDGAIAPGRHGDHARHVAQLTGLAEQGIDPRG